MLWWDYNDDDDDDDVVNDDGGKFRNYVLSYMTYTMMDYLKIKMLIRFSFVHCHYIINAHNIFLNFIYVKIK